MKVAQFDNFIILLCMHFVYKSGVKLVNCVSLVSTNALRFHKCNNQNQVFDIRLKNYVLSSNNFL